ncbi:hypothetical protein BKA93DRAFT_722828 [Sparassis latifolia]
MSSPSDLLPLPTRSKSSTISHVSSGSASPIPPSISRSQTHAATSSLGASLAPSHPSTPFLTPQVSSSNVLLPPTSRRLLMPTVRSPKAIPNGSPRVPPPARFSPSKPPRSRAGSTSNLVPVDPNERSTSTVTSDWIGGGRKFEVVEEQIELEGFQIFAVERWVVERRRPVTALTVLTGEPSHKITVTALSPQSSLSQVDAATEWDNAIRELRREGARAKETDKGTLMVTSLANFRSDYTIVHIPRGNFLLVREQLYTNINILRMGCSGRSALTLEEPSDATKDRFISMYRIPEKALAQSSTLFNDTVLELVKLIQAALTIYGMLDILPEERNGLLCDVTCEGLRRWVVEIGELYMKVEPMERVADPSIVAALFSSILTLRNKLHALGHVVPKDPFVDPQAFIRALDTYISKSTTQSHSHSLSVTQAVIPNTSPLSGSSPSSSGASPVPPAPSIPPVTCLCLPVIESIRSAYEKKMRQNDSYKVHRVLINKLDDLATDIRTTTGASSSEAGSPGSGAATSVNPTSDLSALVKVITGGSKDSPQSLLYLWTGRPGEARKKRRDREVAWSDGEMGEERSREKETEREGEGREKDGKEGKHKEKYDRDKEKEPKLSEDECEHNGPRPWPGRVQRKFENWAALSRTKKLSVDFGTLGKAFLSPESPPRGARIGQSGPSAQPITVPSVVISSEADEDEILSSGQVSPVSEPTVANPSLYGFRSLGPAESSVSELSEYDRRVTEFNQKRPSTKAMFQSRIISWSDPVSARDLLDEDDVQYGRKPNASLLGRSDSWGPSEELSADMDETATEDVFRRRPIAFGLQRRRSFDDALDLKGMRVLPLDRMRIDVDLCGQLLVMHRREAHLANVVACLEALTSSLSRTNSRLRQDHESARPALEDLRQRAHVLQELEAARTRSDALTQETNTLAYESAQFLVDDLWHMAAQPLQRVLALRQKTFGTGRRHPQGIRGAHGRFNWVQWTLDGEERLVDRRGRTESEAEDEAGLPLGAGVDIEAEEEEVDVVENQSLRPTWVLRLFNYWGAKGGASKAAAKDAKGQGKNDKKQEDADESVSTFPSPSPPSQNIRLRGAVRTNTL